ncbi:MAG: hypothetical protein RID91_16540 [Azospirillaceae bacterium]
MAVVAVVEADTVLGRVLCAELAAHGHGVLAHCRDAAAGPPGAVDPGAVDPGSGGVREGSPPSGTILRLTADAVDDALPDWHAAHGPIEHVVLVQPDAGPAPPPGADGHDAFIDALEAELVGFLATLQAAGRLLIRGEGAQIWAITRDDSASHYLPGAPPPMAMRARHAAVKSVGKELYRFGVRVNAATVQTLAEQADPADWRAARHGLKAFAMKFRPIGAEAVAGTLRRYLEQPDLPVAAMIVPIGIGMPENNV